MRSSDPAASLQVAADDDVDDAAAAAGGWRRAGGAPSLSTTSGANRTRLSPLRLLAFALPQRVRLAACAAASKEQSCEKLGIPSAESETNRRRGAAAEEEEEEEGRVSYVPDDVRQGRRACSGAPSSSSGSGSGSAPWERCARQSEKMTREPENATAVAAASAREPPIDDDDEGDMDGVSAVKPSR